MIFILTLLNYKIFYNIYYKDNKQILSTYSYLTPLKVEIVKNDRKSYIVNKDKKNYFVFEKDEKIKPIFKELSRKELLEIVKNNNVNVKLLDVFNNEELLEVYIVNEELSIKKYIEDLFKTRQIDEKLLINKKLSLKNKISIINNLKEDNVRKLKNIQKLFIPILKSKFYYLLDKEYVLNVFDKMINFKNYYILNSIFMIKDIQKTIIEKFLTGYYKDNKIFYNLLDNGYIYEYEKVDIPKTVIEKIKKEKDLYFLYIYFSLHIYKMDYEKIYSNLNKQKKHVFMSIILSHDIKTRISSSLMDKFLEDFDSKEDFKVLLSYSDENNIYYEGIKNKIEKYLDDNVVLINSSLYFNHRIFSALKNNLPTLTLFLDKIVKKDIKLSMIDGFTRENVFDLKNNFAFRINLSRYLIKNNLLSNTSFLKFIKKIHKDNRLKYKTDEEYVSKILPLLSKKYKKEDFKYYLSFLKTRNKTMIESLLLAIQNTNDKDFIKYLKPLLKENEIKQKIKKIIFILKNMNKWYIDASNV